MWKKNKRNRTAPTGTRASLPRRHRDIYGTTVITQQYDNSKIMTPARSIRPRRQSDECASSGRIERGWGNNVQSEIVRTDKKQHIERKKNMHDYRNNDSEVHDRLSLQFSFLLPSLPCSPILFSRGCGRSRFPHRRRKNVLLSMLAIRGKQLVERSKLILARRSTEGC